MLLALFINIALCLRTAYSFNKIVSQGYFMRRLRNAKIVATLGPSSTEKKTIKALFEAGADVFRLNFSHGKHSEHKDRLDAIRAIEKETGRPIAVMADLQGPKFRVGQFKDGPINLKQGDKFRVDLDKALGDQNRVSLPHPEIFTALKVGSNLLINDGRVGIRVTQCGADFALCEVFAGGEVSDNKGVNIPDVQLMLSPLTDKDRADLAYALEIGVDYVALSFVQRPEDVEELRSLISGRARIISKIEKPSAIEHIEAIAKASDVLMVARGDLGVEMPPEDIPYLQKNMVNLCRTLGKPIIIATHMLDSMVSAPVPTRAEASDVANAVYDGADAVMLSAESAAGEYPVESVQMMDRIIQRVDSDPYYRKVLDASRPEPKANSADACCVAIGRMTEVLSAAGTVTYTDSGYTCLRMSRERPDAPILALTPNSTTARHLTLSWGAHPILIDDLTSIEQVVEIACELAVKDGFAKTDDTLIIAAGMPFGEAAHTNLIRVANIWSSTFATHGSQS